MMLSDQLKKYFRSFSNKALIITMILSAIYVVTMFYSPAGTLSPATPAIIIFFLVLTLIIFYYQLKASASRVSKFVNVFLMATGFKLLGFLVIIGVYSFLNKTDAVPFVISFFIVYLIFTVFEITQLLKVQKQLGPKK